MFVTFVFIIQKDQKEPFTGQQSLFICAKLSFIFIFKELCICALSRTRMFDQVLLKLETC